MATTIHLIRGDTEYRKIFISDDHYRINGGKRHSLDELNDYFHHMFDNGWHKATGLEWLKRKYSK